MSLVQNTTIVIDGYDIHISKPIKMWVNDRLTLKITLEQWGVENPNAISFKAPKTEPFPLDGLYANMYVETAIGTDTIESTRIDNNIIQFDINSMHTRHAGTGRMQLVLIDEHGCRLTLPWFDYEVKPTINEDADQPLPDLVVNALVTSDGKLIVTSQNKFIQQSVVWNEKEE